MRNKLWKMKMIVICKEVEQEKPNLYHAIKKIKILIFKSYKFQIKRIKILLGFQRMFHLSLPGLITS